MSRSKTLVSLLPFLLKLFRRSFIEPTESRSKGKTSNFWLLRKNFLWIESGVPSFGKVDYRLLVKGKGNIKLIYDSLKGGYYTKNTNLR